MKYKLLLLVAIFLSSCFSFSQSTEVLEEKKGYMDLKIDMNFDKLKNKLDVISKEKNFYKISRSYLKDYYIDSVEIDKIILVFKEDKVRMISLIFESKIDSLLDYANDTSRNFKKREEALEKAKKLNKKTSRYKYYYNIFESAFGDPDTKDGVDLWESQNYRLMTLKEKSRGVFGFSRILTREEMQAENEKKAKEAKSKF